MRWGKMEFEVVSLRMSEIEGQQSQEEERAKLHGWLRSADFEVARTGDGGPVTAAVGRVVAQLWSAAIPHTRQIHASCDHFLFCTVTSLAEQWRNPTNGVSIAAAADDRQSQISGYCALVRRTSQSM